MTRALGLVSLAIVAATDEIQEIFAKGTSLVGAPDGPPPPPVPAP